MSSRTSRRLLAAVLCLSLALPLSGCFGQFALTKTLHGINGEVREPYLRSAVTWAFLVPYAFTSVIDLTVFNVIEFWTGENPMAVRNAALPGGGSAVVTLLRDGGRPLAVVDRYEGGRLIETVAVGDDGSGGARAVASRGGRTIREFRALLRPDGSLDVYEDGSLAPRVHSASEVAAVASAMVSAR